jgi:hypothetical protein
MIGNAHIDPVWLWRWQAGLDEVLASFRAAADPAQFPEQLRDGLRPVWQDHDRERHPAEEVRPVRPHRFKLDQNLRPRQPRNAGQHAGRAHIEARKPLGNQRIGVLNVIVHVGHVGIHPHDVGKTHARIRQRLLDIVQRHIRLAANIAGVHDLAVRRNRRLSVQKQNATRILDQNAGVVKDRIAPGVHLRTFHLGLHVIERNNRTPSAVRVTSG